MKDDCRCAPHILIVDDEVAITYVFKRYFEREGYRISVAYDGASALALSKSDPVDGLITDFRMPGMNGQELLLRLQETNPAIPAIIVSAYPDEIGAKPNNTRVLAKPVEPARLIRCLKELLADAATITNLRRSGGQGQ